MTRVRKRELARAVAALQIHLLETSRLLSIINRQYFRIIGFAVTIFIMRIHIAEALPGTLTKNGYGIAVKQGERLGIGSARINLAADVRVHALPRPIANARLTVV
jgi:hypothetical protein